MMSEQFDMLAGAQSIADAFAEFHQANPHVYELLRTRALRAKQAGFRPGIGCLFELLRYQMGLKTRGDDLKLNNNFRAHYARALMAREPELAGFFELRRLRSE